MSEKQKETSDMKIGFLGLLTLIFITLKLTGYITWSWLWVLAPIWIPFAIGISIVLVCLVMAAIFTR